jgi:hypothetical protein
MLGRMFFPLGTFDEWQVMPYLVGEAGTGKSLVLQVMMKLHREGAVAVAGSKREEKFGLANLADAELVVGMDMPQALSAALPQEMLQSMVSGEQMEVPRKNEKALQVEWKAPVALASNHMPDYVNTGNNVGRRLAVFKFENVVTAPHENLKRDILSTELPQIACRFLRAYHAQRERVAAAGSFWRSVPAQMLQWQGELAAATNKLHEFLAQEPEERGGWIIERVEGHFTLVDRFADAFKAKMETKYKHDAAVLARFGFYQPNTKANLCKSCGAMGGTRGKCCPNYKSDKRDKKYIIMNIRMVRVQPEHQEQCDPLDP